MEDYNADFLTMLETWEAAVGHLYPPTDGHNLIREQINKRGAAPFGQRHVAEQAGLSKDQQSTVSPSNVR